MTIFEKLKAAGCQMSSHESDLYVEASEIAERLTAHEPNKTYFVNQQTKTLWIELPFRFDPWWEKRTGKPLTNDGSRLHLEGQKEVTQ